VAPARLGHRSPSVAPAGWRPQLKRDPLGGLETTTRMKAHLPSLLLASAFVLHAPLHLLGQAPPLSTVDFALGGVSENTDSAAVRRGLGKPDSVLVGASPFDVGAKLVTWRYPRLTVEFFSTDHVVGLSTTDSTVATPRGLRVGDSVTRLKQLYGETTDSCERDCDYEDPAQHLHVMSVRIRNGRVSQLYLGYLLD